MDDCLIYVDIEVEGAICISAENVCQDVGNQYSTSQYFFGYINNTSYTSNFTGLPLDMTSFTIDSVNDSFEIFADGIQYCYYDNQQNFSDQVKIEGNVFSFLYEVSRLSIRFTNRLILK